MTGILFRPFLCGHVFIFEIFVDVVNIVWTLYFLCGCFPFGILACGLWVVWFPLVPSWWVWGMWRPPFGGDDWMCSGGVGPKGFCVLHLPPLRCVSCR